MSSFQSRFLVFTAGLMLAAAQAGALGTDAGTDIDNTATVDYEVGGVNQPDVDLEHRDVRGRPGRHPGRRRDRRRLHRLGPGPDRAGADLHGHQQLERPARLPARGGPGHHRHHRGPRRHRRLRRHHSRGVRRLQRQRRLRRRCRHGGRSSTKSPRTTRSRCSSSSTIPLGQANGKRRASRSRRSRPSPDGRGLGADAAETGAEDPDAIDTVFGDVAGDTDGGDGQHSDDDAYRIQTARSR